MADPRDGRTLSSVSLCVSLSLLGHLSLNSQHIVVSTAQLYTALYLEPEHQNDCRGQLFCLLREGKSEMLEMLSGENLTKIA